MISPRLSLFRGAGPTTRALSLRIAPPDRGAIHRCIKLQQPARRRCSSRRAGALCSWALIACAGMDGGWISAFKGSSRPDECKRLCRVCLSPRSCSCSLRSHFRCLLLQAAVWYYMEDACEVSVGACHARAVGSALMKTDVSSTNRFCLTISLLHVRTIKMRVFGKNEDFSAFAVTRANRFLLDDQFTTCSENQSREEMVSEGKSHAICCSNSWRRLVQR